MDLTTVKNVHKSPLRSLCEGMVEASVQYPLHSAEWPSESEPFQDACSTIVAVSRSLLGLMVPEYRYMDISTAETLHLAKYGGR